MKRKYDLRNKRNFIIILGLAIILIIIFSLFIYKYKHTSQIAYKVDTGSIVQDVSKNFVNVTEDATLKMRWNDNYYLDYQDKKTNLSKNVIVYNTVSGELKLYGKFYEIDSHGKVIDNVGETVLRNTSDTKFYKIADREYLLVDRQIVSSDKSINADNYLLVELDKMGNAKLTNNKLNLKTITKTILLTSKYSFDIANEILKYGNDEIDLKKIIGTTNQYKEEDNGEEGGGGEDNQENQDNNEQNQPVENNQANNAEGDTGGGNGTDVVVEKPEDPLEGMTIEEIKSKVKMSSVVNYKAGLTNIDIDYIVYDPYNEYQSVFVEVYKDGSVEKINLNKTDTHVVIDKLKADTSYRIDFIYTVIDYETGEAKQNQFDQLVVKTNKPVYSGEVTGIYPFISKKLTYTISLQNNYNINKLNATVIYSCINDENEVVQRRIPVSHNITNNQKTVNGFVDISDCKIEVNNQEKVIINSVSGDNGTITFN